MLFIRRPQLIRPIAITLVCAMLAQFAFPLSAYALTSGPSQPEFSSFEPVSTVKMVDEFTGDMTYNLPLLEIPGPDGSGYPISLSYHSGATPEEEASWVGYGWTLNPGAISRGKSGLPDDYKGEEVIDHNDVPANWTIGLRHGPGFELFGVSPSLSLNAGIRYNNYRGFGFVAGANLGFDFGSLGYSYADGDGAFHVRINPLSKLGERKQAQAEDKRGTELRNAFNHYLKTGNLDEGKQLAREANNQYSAASRKASNISKVGFSLPTFDMHRASSVTPYTGIGFNFSTAIGVAPLPIPGVAGGDITGNFSMQVNKKQQSLDAYGYMYSADVPSNSDGDRALMDYMLEREAPFEYHDHYLPIPFSSPDYFMASGEGVGGSFRLHQRETGHFRPNKVRSFTTIGQVGLEFEIGAAWGGGNDFGLGENNITVHDWGAAGLGFSSEGDEPVFFRFGSDPGGHIVRDDILAEAADIGIITDWATNPGLPAFTGGTLDETHRAGRSNHIGYHTNGQMRQHINNRYTHSYTRDLDLLNSTDHNRTGHPEDGIGELVITSGTGLVQVYGLPVYSRNEVNLSFLMWPNDGAPITVRDNHTVFGAGFTKDAARFKVGREVNTPYATQFLMTEIRTPDYVDRTDDGPTDDDFGGWTKFSYDRIIGTADKTASPNNWYKWRAPYEGLGYNVNSLSDRRDDVGTVSYGEKELYYLETIETKTHYATFVTSDREDGKDANHAESAAVQENQPGGTLSLKKLDKIKLFRKPIVANGTPTLLLTVNFQYDYSAFDANGSGCGELPNSSNGMGKLTLRRVWYDYEGVQNALISPYEFYYQYPRTATSPPSYYQGPCAAPSPSAGLPPHYLTFDMPFGSKYADLADFGKDLNQTPAFNPKDIDPWGNYQQGGDDRYENFRTWVNQNPADEFDPAAYQLKSIKLPSGGQIHIQYEQDDYQYVQDRNAHAMVSLGTYDDKTNNTNYYYLDTNNDLGNPSPAELAEIEDMIEKVYVLGKKKMYFKFLYSLVGDDPNFGPNHCDAEFIDGYVRVESVTNTGTNIMLKLGAPGNALMFPKQICQDFFKTQRKGMVVEGTDCNYSAVAVGGGVTIAETVMQLGGLLSSVFSGECKRLDPEHSYFRIPVKKKVGGGLRVKRVLMYDKGLETNGGDAIIYGTEYLYTDVEGNSSGVSTREPSPVRFEDPLVEPLNQNDQSLLNRIIAGRDRTELEGPLGESLLPGASVGYSRVVAKSIHTGRTSPGFTVSEFYTMKDYPYDMQYPTLDDDLAVDATEMKRPLRTWVPPVPGLAQASLSIDNRNLSQGYRFVQFDISGRPKSYATYGSGFDAQGNPAPSTQFMTAHQQFEYYLPGQSLPMMNDIDEIDQVGWYPGQEMEIATESRVINDITLDGNIEADVEVGLLITPIVFATFVPTVNYTERRLKTHVTSKVIRYPAIQKAVVSTQDGIVSRTEPVYFNPETGQPVVTRTTDGYDGLTLQQSTNHVGTYHAYEIPGSREYKALGQKALNEGMTLPRLLPPGNLGNDVTIQKAMVGGVRTIIVTGTANGGVQAEYDAMQSLCPGSKVIVKNGSTVDGVYHIGRVNGYTAELLPSAFFPSTTNSITNATVTILESGKKNRLADVVGGFTTYGGLATVTTTPNPGLSGRAQVAIDLNAELQQLLQSGQAPFQVDFGSCEFRNAHSPDQGIRLIPLANNQMEVQLLDWASTSETVMCSEVIPNYANGHFEIDPQSGEIVFYASATSLVPFNLPCLRFCENMYENRSIGKVVVASAISLKDDWTYSSTAFGPAPSGANKYETGEWGKWRTEGSYQYRKDIIHGANDQGSNGERIYKDAGVFTLSLFNYAQPTANDPFNWLNASFVTRYNPNGQAVEEKDILGIFSSVKFGYNQQLPTLVAKNAKEYTTYFESFEMLYGSKVEEGLSITTANRTSLKRHAGAFSYKLVAEQTFTPFWLEIPSVPMVNGGFSLQVWVHDESQGQQSIRAELRSFSNTVPLNMVWLARSGEWNLYEGQILPNGWNPIMGGEWVTPVLLPVAGHPNVIYIDDVRYQPLDAQMSCFVYDPATFKLLTTFDDQHFGVYNIYNGEGKLVRKAIETERGIKTVQETQHHLPTQIRPLL